MGVCLCKCKGEEPSNGANNHDRRGRNSSINIQAEEQPDWYMPGNGSNWWKSVSAKVVDNLVLDTLNVIGTLVEK